MGDQDEADTSGSTAEFRAFADKSRGGEVTQAWAMKAPPNQVAKLVAIAVGVAVALAIVAFLVIG
jgi:hypothetical protein